MKLKLTLILLLMICPLVANQVRMRPGQPVTRSKKLDQPECRSGVVDGEQELIDIEVDENINTEDLVQLWARLANKVAAPFFVLYNNFSKWLNTRQEASHLKKNRYIKRF